ncbi:hypothetical protein HDU91_004316 [Kappamyces sp. JEL0680]|nr:hypothetical protein HDU91_004316 [Kappamyces sp. JEL0680]
MPSFTAAQVAAHNKESDVWIIVHGKILVKVAGQDATKQFDNFHNKAILDKWGPALYKGDVGSDAVAKPEEPEEPLQGLEEWDNFHEFVVCDELSRTGSGGFLWGLIGGLGIGLPPVVNFGSDYLKDKVVKDCLAGRKHICLAITEPSGGSDVANL